MGKVITSDNTIKRLTELERQRCCNRNQFLPTFDDFPTTGEDNVLYIDKEKSKIYLWNGSIYITADDLVGHTNIVATTPYDSLNPLTGWIAPTTPYFGNTATVLFTDDIIVNFTFNGTIWEEKIIDDTAISGIKTANTVYVDGTYGDDTTGRRESRDFPFQTFTQAMSVYEDGDWLKYENSDEAISGTNIFPLLTKYYYDFGNGNITINSGGNAFIGPQNFTDVLEKNVTIKSSGVFTNNKALRSAKNGGVSLTLNKWVASSYTLASKGDITISANELESTTSFPLGFFSGSNKNINVDINKVTITNTNLTGYTAGIGQYETSGENTDNLNVVMNIDNLIMNTNVGHILSLSGTGGFQNLNSNYTVNVNNVNQVSLLYDPLVNKGYQHCLFNMGRPTSTFGNIKFTANFNFIESDLPLINTNATYNDCILNFSGNAVIKKGELIYFTSSNTLNNSKLNLQGNFEVVNPLLDSIYLNNLSLTNNSVFLFDCNYKAASKISLAGLTIDSTSKIIFKGRYELGAGYFDISGVTGAGADNVYFEDCTIVTSGTECIVSGSAKNVKILNVRSNKPVNANVTELVSSILINANIN
jgi:hypothetical protein